MSLHLHVVQAEGQSCVGAWSYLDIQNQFKTEREPLRKPVRRKKKYSRWTFQNQIFKKSPRVHHSRVMLLSIVV